MSGGCHMPAQVHTLKRMACFNCGSLGLHLPLKTTLSNRYLALSYGFTKDGTGKDRHIPILRYVSHRHGPPQRN